MTSAASAPNNMAIREATRADLLDVLRIENAVFPQPWPYSAFERLVTIPGFLVYEGTGEWSESHDAPVTGTDIPTDRQAKFDVEQRDSSSGENTQGMCADVSTTGTPILGYVVADAVSNRCRTTGHIKNLAVRPDSQNRGVGSALLERGLSVLARQGAHAVKLEARRSNDAAISLYQRFGFEHFRTIPNYYEDGEDALLLVLHFTDRDGF